MTRVRINGRGNKAAYVCPMRRCQGRHGCKCTYQQKSDRARRRAEIESRQETQHMQISPKRKTSIATKRVEKVAANVALDPGPHKNSPFPVKTNVEEEFIEAKKYVCRLRRCQGKRGCICSPHQIASRVHERALCHRRRIAATARARAYRATAKEPRKAASTETEPPAKQAAREVAEAAVWLPEGDLHPEELASRPFVRWGLCSRHSRGDVATSAGVTSWTWLTAAPHINPSL